MRRHRRAWFAALLLGAACSSTGASPPADTSPSAGTLRGTINAQPFDGKSAFGKRRSENGGMDVVVFEMALPPSRGCDQLLVRGDTDRIVLVQMPWPSAVGTTLQSLTARELAQRQLTTGIAAVELSVRRKGAESWNRAVGTVTVKSATPNEGVLTIDARTQTEVNGITGSIAGALPFTICPSP